MQYAKRRRLLAQLRAIAGASVLLFSFVFNASPLFAVSSDWQKGMLGIEHYSGTCGNSGSSSGSGNGTDNKASTASGGTSSVPADADGWTFPVTPGTPITSDYKAPDRPGHRGVDLGAPADSPIYASRDGTVVAAGPASGFGNWIVIEHEENGKRVDSVYGHMYDDGVLVKVGDKVKAGQQIGKVGSNGESSGPHLHYEEWDGGRFNGTERKPVAVYGGSGGAAPSSGSGTTPQPNSSDTASCCQSGSGGTTTAPLEGSDNAEKIWNYLTKTAGLTPEQAAGVMGNLAWESGDPTFNKATASIEQGSGAGFGLAQWTGGRRTQIENAAGGDTGKLTDLQFQLDYLVAESQGRQALDGGNEWGELKNQKTVEDATQFWMDNYERPGLKAYDKRLELARQYLQKYGGKSSGTGGSATSSQCTPADKKV